jgi:5-methylcytosine-specific restriction endonuclease McrA
MLKVVRRDGQICQACQQPVRDDEVEFDHLIPVARGGPVTADNLRLLCRPCNRAKRDSLSELVSSKGWFKSGR